MGNRGSNSNAVCLASTDLWDGVYRPSTTNCDQPTRARTSSPRRERNISFSKADTLRRQSIYSIISTRSVCNDLWPVSQVESSFLPVFPLRTANVDNSFEFLRKVCTGSFCDIHLVRKLGTDYILKIYSKRRIIYENSVERTKSEVQILRACNHHPFIINYVESWQSKKHIYIVCDYYGKGDLFEFMKNFLLTNSLQQLYIAQIALAIDFLHNAGIIHRDVKPENIFVDARHNLKLGDFDLAKWLPYGQRTATKCGTIRYMAPELMANREYGHAVDWWSLGVISCYLFTSQSVQLVPTVNAEDSLAIKLNYPESVFSLSKDKRELLFRLLEMHDTRRMKSIRALQNIRYYFGYNLEDVQNKKIDGAEVWEKYQVPAMATKCDFVEDFDVTSV